VQADGSNPRLWELLGRVLLQLKDEEAAEEALREAIRLRPDRVATHLRLITALLQQAKADEARKVLEDIPRKRRLATIVQKYYGDVYTVQGHHKEAVASYRAALLGTPGGEQTVAAVEEDAGSGAEPDWIMLIERYQPELTKVLANARNRRRANKR
jgi:cytochrome c-type biogenesis protein CcmH/NrfG